MVPVTGEPTRGQRLSPWVKVTWLAKEKTGLEPRTDSLPFCTCWGRLRFTSYEHRVSGTPWGGGSLSAGVGSALPAPELWKGVFRTCVHLPSLAIISFTSGGRTNPLPPQWSLGSFFLPECIKDVFLPRFYFRGGENFLCGSQSSRH